jgi:hypothetical protein
VNAPYAADFPPLAQAKPGKAAPGVFPRERFPAKFRYIACDAGPEPPRQFLPGGGAHETLKSGVKIVRAGYPEKIIVRPGLRRPFRFAPGFPPAF